jgi:hypothetical protein
MSRDRFWRKAALRLAECQQWKSQGYLIVGYAIYPPTRHLAVKVRLFLEFLVERFSAGPKAGIGRSSAMDA